MSFARFLMITLTDNLAILYQDATNSRVWMGGIKPLSSQFDCTGHELVIRDGKLGHEIIR